MNTQSHIRNFAIIAHIDHGKSTLADRLMELTGTTTKREMQEQLLDSNPIERERGITIKLAPVRMSYQKTEDRGQKTEDREQRAEDGERKIEGINPSSVIRHPSSYILNLIDTPGHVDFTYEVSRSLAACEGALLVVDATQGVQAQTLANLHLAREHHLTIIPLINKIDLPNARIEETKQELCNLGFKEGEIVLISAKTGQGVADVLNAIIERIPFPQGDPDSQTRALVFSSQYDTHKGVVVFVRVVDGSLPFKVPFKGLTLKGLYSNSGQIRFLQSGSEVTPIEIGYFSPRMVASGGLTCGEVGYIATGLKDVRMAKVGDTITVEKTEDRRQKTEDRGQRTEDGKQRTENLSSVIRFPSSVIQPLPGYHEPKPMVFVGLFPIEQEEFTKSREAMEKLRLSDSAFSFRPISSTALGNGFHCGFLGLLHAEIVQERLSREFGLSLLATAPSVEYRVQLKAGVNPSKAGILSSGQRTEDRGQRTEDEKQRTENPSSVIRFPSSVFSITSPSEFPDPTFIESVEEPMMKLTMYAPKQYIGPIMQLSQEKRGEYIDLVYHMDQAEFTYLIPLSDMIVDFFDNLKSVTEGYASLDYEFFEYQKADVIKVDILVNHEKVDALSFLAVRDQARLKAKNIVDRLADVLPRQQFNIPVQAAIGGEIIARADIKPYRKDVIAKLYGGDRTRKDKLLKKQKRGKEKMKHIGSVEIPQDAFFTVLKRN